MIALRNAALACAMTASIVRRKPKPSSSAAALAQAGRGTPALAVTPIASRAGTISEIAAPAAFRAGRLPVSGIDHRGDGCSYRALPYYASLLNLPGLRPGLLSRLATAEESTRSRDGSSLAEGQS